MTESTTETVGETPPFLRITATYSAGNDRVDTVTLELNLGDGDDIGEYEPDYPTAVKTWVTDFVTSAVDALRRHQAPDTIRLDGAARQLLADLMRHTDNCVSDCGMAPTGEAGGPPAAADTGREAQV